APAATTRRGHARRPCARGSMPTSPRCFAHSVACAPPTVPARSPFVAACRAAVARAAPPSGRWRTLWGPATTRTAMNVGFDADLEGIHDAESARAWLRGLSDDPGARFDAIRALLARLSESATAAVRW